MPESSIRSKNIKLTNSSGIPINPATETTYNQISIASDNITTINYTDATKTAVATIVQSSVSVGLTATETFNNSGATTLVITRSVT